MEKDLAELFLIDFINNLIEVQSPSGNWTNQQIAEEDQSAMQKSVLKPKQQKETKIHKFNPLQEIKTNIKKQLPIKKPIKIPQEKRFLLTYPTIQNTISTTDKLNLLMKDPYVSEVECVGSESPLIVQKSGIAQKTQIKLSIDEIYELIAEFSQKTRIPVINGRIKAALNNLIITAVFSETLGPRFIIQKKRQLTNTF